MIAPTMSPLNVTVFPRASVVPANILRWHLVFDRPVAVDGWAQAVKLVDADGREVPHAFLDLPQGLWDAEGRVLTILMHPGRIKSGIGDKQDGTAINPGYDYALIIDLAAFDPDQRPAKAVEHRFNAGDPTTTAINPRNWTIIKPSSGSSEPMIVQTDFLLDHQSASACLAAQDRAGRAVEIVTTHGDDDHTMLIRPASDFWPARDVELVVTTELEDVTGQRIGQAFEHVASNHDRFPATCV